MEKKKKERNWNGRHVLNIASTGVEELHFCRYDEDSVLVGLIAYSQKTNVDI